MILSELTDLARAGRAAVERRKGERDTLAARKAELEQQLANDRAQSAIVQQAAVLLREASDYAREQTCQQVEALTTSALGSVFGPGYRFALESGKLGDRPAVWCRLVSPYGEGEQLETEGMESRGGGVVDIQAIALRWAMLETARPAIEGPLLLDEPAKHVSADHIPAAGTFLRQACQQFGRQVIMVTHIDHLAELADRVFAIELHDGASRVRSVSGGGAGAA